MTRQFGDIAGVAVGTSFESREGVAQAGVHRPLQAGISGAAKEGADSIVVSGGYEDDADYGQTILYTGHGGRDQTGKQVADQTLTRQNLALAVSADRGLPVRVVRGAGGEPTYSPASGYRYDGLYYVESYTKDKGQSGFDIWQFRLVQSPPTDPITNPPAAPAPSGRAPGAAAGQRFATVQRLVRNTAVTQWVKELYDFECQVCGERLETRAGAYAEGAHVRPVGQPHHGPDSIDNVLCLCPNHHVLFDRGVFGFDGSGHVIEYATGRATGRLNIDPHHGLEAAHAQYHWSLFN